MRATISIHDAATQMTPENLDLRRQLAVEGGTDLERWSRADEFMPQWATRAKLAAQLLPAYSHVIDLGCGAMDLEKFLPTGCKYTPVDLVRRDQRTLVCDFNQDQFPDLQGDQVTMLGVLEYIREPAALLRKIRAWNIPLVCSYPVTDRTPDLDRRSQGWINDLSSAAFERMCIEAGFRKVCHEMVDNSQDLYKWVPAVGVQPSLTVKKVLVLSYMNDPNFGDRLGYHLINDILPAGVTVYHATVKPWTVPDEHFDMLVVGIGNSLNAATVQRPELHELINRVEISVGIFGTQYRGQYKNLIDPKWMNQLLDRLTHWYARYEEDLLAFGQGRSNVSHLGDWLISAFPLVKAEVDNTLIIAAQIKTMDQPLDRLIQKIQRYKRVSSARIHPMLCALTSAEQIKYQEQYEYGGGVPSEKFRSQLYDVFGRTYAQDVFFDVDKELVRMYKRKVARNMAALRQDLDRWLR